MTPELWVTLIGMIATPFVGALSALLTYKISVKKMKTEEKEAQAKAQKSMEENLNKKIDSMGEKMDTKIDNLHKEVTTKMESFSKDLRDMTTSYQQMETTVNLRMDIIEKKQDKYNGVIERQYKTEAAVFAIREDIEELKDAQKR